MKHKIILCFALALGGAFFGCGNIARGIEQRPVIGPMPTNLTTKLQIRGAWSNITVKVVVPGSTNPPVKCIIEDVPGKWAIYEVVPKPPSPYLYEFAVQAYHNPHTKMNCITAGNRTFYTSDKSGASLGFSVHAGGARWGPSYFEMPDAEGNLEAAIAKFEKVCDGKTLNDGLLEERHHNGVAFGKASPIFFNLVQPVGGAKFAQMKVEGFDITNDIVRVEVRNLATKQLGTYWFDPKEHKIIKSMVDGHEMNLDSGEPWAEPK